MHGVIAPKDDQRVDVRTIRRRKVQGWARRNWALFAFVLLPTLLVAAYYYVIAADQYESEVHFVVRSSDATPTVGTGLSSLATWVGGAAPSQTDAMSVADYLTSHDVVEALRGQVGLVERFRRPEADFVSRLQYEQPTPESLLKYYRKQVDVHFNSDTGITTVKVKAFRPEDSYVIASRLLQLGEQRVNSLNVRSLEDALTSARRQLMESEAGLRVVQSQFDRFRSTRNELDPAGAGEAQFNVVSQLQVTLSTARAQLAGMAGLVSPSSPQYVALAARVRALEAQLAGQQARIAGAGQGTIASNVTGYEDLKLRQGFAAKRYETAAAALERAREGALRKQLYLVRVVDPNMPGKALYPERFRILATVFLSLLVAYGIGWLIVAGVKEHTA